MKMVVLSRIIFLFSVISFSPPAVFFMKAQSMLSSVIWGYRLHFTETKGVRRSWGVTIGPIAAHTGLALWGLPGTLEDTEASTVKQQQQLHNLPFWAKKCKSTYYLLTSCPKAISKHILKSTNLYLLILLSDIILPLWPVANLWLVYMLWVIYTSDPLRVYMLWVVDLMTMADAHSKTLDFIHWNSKIRHKIKTKS